MRMAQSWPWGSQIAVKKTLHLPFLQDCHPWQGKDVRKTCQVLQMSPEHQKNCVSDENGLWLSNVRAK